MTFITYIRTFLNEIEIHNSSYVALPTQDGTEGILSKHQNDQYVIVPGLCIVHDETFKTIQSNQARIFQIGAGTASFQNNILHINVQYIIENTNTLDPAFLNEIASNSRLAHEVKHYSEKFAKINEKEN